MKKRISFILASVFGVGYAPFASGTFGSLAAVPLGYFIINNYGMSDLLISILFVYIIGTIATVEVLKYTKHDPSIVVIDEVAGQLITFIPLVYLSNDWRLYLIGFLLFRLFDITKPWPASYFDNKVMNSHGVMLDDVAAGIYAALALWGISCLL